MLSNPRVNEVWDNWEKDPNPAVKLKIIPLFPQYSESTIASGLDGLGQEIKKRVKIPEISVVTNFHQSRAFIDNSAKQIDKYLERFKTEGKSIDKLLLTFHGIQKRRVIYKEDPYYRHCYETFYLIRERVTKIDHKKMQMTFQSRFGSEEWLTPYTEETVIKLSEAGNKNIAVYSPSFVSDCLETLDELGTELKHTANEHGGDIHFIPCLNDDDLWCKDFAQYVENQVLAGQVERAKDFYSLEKNDYLEFKNMSQEELKMKAEPMSAAAKSTLKMIFLTIFLDLLGFSIIFPLFPTLAKHYLTIDADNVFLKAIFGSIESIGHITHGSSLFGGLVLFGGILGALYSLLQFIAAPIWGSLSDRVGRKPVLVISLTGMAISYLIWFFSGSFTLLLIARFIGGIMGGNISTATAVVADVTTKENRSKGMAIIGIAFALGFVIGPALGGMLSLINLTAIYPDWSHYGVNPFSMPAALAFVLSVFNVMWVALKFKESLPPEKRGKTASERSANPFKIFKLLPYTGVNTVNFGHFLFLTAFSGMEFTLTFLAHERFNYTSMQNAYIFIFIGFILAFVQGGVVRRKAASIGEKKMATMGLILLIPGLLSIAFAKTTLLLYVGLFFLACGSAMVIPCLTSLVTLYTPAEVQGKSIGIFRSLGALARVLGPIFAAIVYYKFGSSSPYLFGSAFLLIPIYMISKLPPTSKNI